MLCFQLFRRISDVLDNRIPQPLLTTSTLFIFTFCIFKEVGLIREKHVAPWRRRWCSTGTKWLSTRRDVATSRRWIISLWASNRQIREIGHPLTWLCPHLLRAIPRRIRAERGCNFPQNRIEVVRSGWGIPLSNISDMLRKSWKHNITEK